MVNTVEIISALIDPLLNALATDNFDEQAYAHIDRLQQVDFHIAYGLSHSAPSYVVGVGYSFRVDGLFR